MDEEQYDKLFLEDGGIIVDYHGSPVYVTEDYNDKQFDAEDFLTMVFKEDCHSNLNEFADMFDIEFENVLSAIIGKGSEYTPEELIGNAFSVTTSDDLITAED